MTIMMLKKHIHLIFLMLSALTIQAMGTLMAQNNDVKVHIVKSKETVYSLAKQYGIEQDAIYTLNPSAVEGIQEGQTLLIPNRNVSIPNIKQSGGKHKIQAKETLYSISRLYGLSEEELMAANPGISAANFPIGYVLSITPSASKSSSTSNYKQNSSTAKVAILLPLTGSGSKRYIDFYQGFLMGVYKMKKLGYSLDLQVYPIGEMSELDQLIKSGKLNSNQLIIGGINNDQISRLAKFAAANNIQYVIPFYSNKSEALIKNTGFQINPPKEMLFPFIAEAIARKYKGQRILMISGTDAEDSFAQYLRKYLREQGIAYEQYSAFTEQSKIVSALRSTSSNLLLVPCNAKTNLLNRLLNLSDTNGSASRISFFGYPEWQSYGSNTLTRLRKYNSSFFSTFYFDEEQKESTTFKREYYAWYNQSVANSYPKYSILGYDIANYFLAALGQFGRDLYKNLPQLASDGIQSDFHFRYINDKSEALVNCNVFFITLQSNGKTLRMPIVN